MLNLRGQNAADLDFYSRQVADQYCHLLFATHRQQRTLAENLQFGREGRNPDDLLEAFAQHVAAKRADTLFDLHIDIAADVGLVLEGMVVHLLAFGRDRFERQFVAGLEHLLADLAGVGPGVGALFVAFFGFALRVLQWQHPGRYGLLHGAFVNVLGGG